MSTKEKLLLVWIFAVVVFSLVFHHFWAGAVFTLGKAVALSLVSLPALAKFSTAIFGVNFLL